MEDEKIIELYWNRDSEALRQINQKYGAFCYNIAHNILEKEEDAKECVNDTWFKIWMTIPPERPKFLQVFLGKITRRLSLERYQRSRAARRGGNAADAIYKELEECTLGGSSDRQVDAAVIADAVSRFLAELPHDDRIIFVRRYWFADSARQIASRYDMSESWIRFVLRQSREKLKVFLEKEGITI